MFSKRDLVFLTFVLSSSSALAEQSTSDVKKPFSRDCGNVYTTTCLKLDLVSWVDKLNEENDYSVLPGVSVVKDNASDKSNTADIVAELARDFPNDPDARLDAFLIKKVTSYLNSHSLRLDLLNKNDVGTARGGGGGGGGNRGGGGKGGGGHGGMFLAAAALMKGTLLALALGGIAAIAGKALMTGLISLLLSAIIGLKALTHHGKSTTYEIVAKPVYTHANTHSVSHEEHGYGGYGHSSYGRSIDMPIPLGLQPDYKPE